MSERKQRLPISKRVVIKLINSIERTIAKKECYDRYDKGKERVELKRSI